MNWERNKSWQVNKDWERVDPQTCNVARGTQIPCKLEHEAGGDTTFSYREHNLQMPGFCIGCHAEKAPLPCDNLGTGKVENDIGKHAPEDQAFS